MMASSTGVSTFIGSVSAFGGSGSGGVAALQWPSLHEGPKLHQWQPMHQKATCAPQASTAPMASEIQIYNKILNHILLNNSGCITSIKSLIYYFN